MKTVITIIFALVIGIPIAAVGVGPLMEMGNRPAVVDHERGARAAESVRQMLAGSKSSDDITPVQRARWACSGAIKQLAHVPDSIRWTRRSTWPSAEVEAGIWQVRATFEAKNRLGVELPESKTCKLRVTGGGEFVVMGVL